MATKVERYEGIDGLKAYSIIGIVLMHVLVNGEYGIGGFVFERLIPSFTNLVFLFMMVSGFGICFEIYLCHMVIYRVLEKLHLVHLFRTDLLAYLFTAVAVICGSVVFSVCAKWFLNKIEIFLKERVRRVNHV